MFSPVAHWGATNSAIQLWILELLLSVTCKANDFNLSRSASHYDLAQKNKLPVLRSPMRRQKSQSQSQQTERFLSYKCKNCNCEFATLRSYDCHRRHQRAQGSPCSDEYNKSETTFSGRAGLATGILRQHSLAKVGEWFTSWQISKILIK